jgi:hypothetical protein
MYWSGCQSTGAEIRKYLTVPGLAHYSIQIQGNQVPGARCTRTSTDRHRQTTQRAVTYGYRLAAVRRCCLVAGSAVRLGLEERSRAQQSAPGVGPSASWETCCAATRPSVDGCLNFGVGKVRRR